VKAPRDLLSPAIQSTSGFGPSQSPDRLEPVGRTDALLGSASRHHGLTRDRAGALRPTGDRSPRLLGHLIACPCPPQPPDPEPAIITRVDCSALRPPSRCPSSESLITAPWRLTLPLPG